MRINTTRSVKKHDRHGEPVYMCNPCRREAYRPKHVWEKTDVSWNKKAKDINSRLIAKYSTV